jgi:hypothetical protein
LLAASGARAADAASIGSTVYLAGVHGTDPDPLRQVDEVVQKAHEQLGREGFGIGNMVQHTIFIKDGAIDPINVLQRFHAAATRLAPSLKERRSVGTIIRVPDFPDRASVIMLDIVAGAPKVTGAADDFARIPFTFGRRTSSRPCASVTSCTPPGWRRWISAWHARAGSTRSWRRSSPARWRTEEGRTDDRRHGVAQHVKKGPTPYVSRSSTN